MRVREFPALGQMLKGERWRSRVLDLIARRAEVETLDSPIAYREPTDDCEVLFKARLMITGRHGACVEKVRRGEN
jgi:hypothetical protein